MRTKKTEKKKATRRRRGEDREKNIPFKTVACCGVLAVVTSGDAAGSWGYLVFGVFADF
jgi:hypothetical protein